MIFNSYVSENQNSEKYIKLIGYGENNMGFFMLEGKAEVDCEVNTKMVFFESYNDSNSQDSVDGQKSPEVQEMEEYLKRKRLLSSRIGKIKFARYYMQKPEIKKRRRQRKRKQKQKEAKEEKKESKQAEEKKEKKKDEKEQEAKKEEVVEEKKEENELKNSDHQVPENSEAVESQQPQSIENKQPVPDQELKPAPIPDASPSPTPESHPKPVEEVNLASTLIEMQPPPSPTHIPKSPKSPSGPRQPILTPSSSLALPPSSGENPFLTAVDLNLLRNPSDTSVDPFTKGQRPQTPKFIGANSSFLQEDHQMEEEVQMPTLRPDEGNDIQEEQQDEMDLDVEKLDKLE